MTVYRHYSDAAFCWAPDRTYSQDGRHKPRGLWLDADGAWRQWCEREQFQIHCLAVAHRVEFDPTDVLLLADAEAIRWLAAAFPRRTGFDVSAIDWQRVAAAYAGVACVPHLWSLRYEVPWYYGWDCASVCLWDLSIVTSFERESP